MPGNHFNRIRSIKHLQTAKKTMQSLQSDVVALESDVDLTNSSYSYLVRTQRIYFIFGNVFIYPSNKYNNNCFFEVYREYCPRLSRRPCKLGRYLNLGQYFMVQIEKTITLLMYVFFYFIMLYKLFVKLFIGPLIHRKTSCEIMPICLSVIVSFSSKTMY